MDETRKRYVMTGVVVGAAAVGLVVLARRTPSGQWSETVIRVGRDALDFARTRYGNNTYVMLAEKALEQLERKTAEEAAVAAAAIPSVDSEPVQAEANAI